MAIPVTRSKIGRLLRRHYASLPTWEGDDGSISWWPSWLWFAAVPVAVCAGAVAAGVRPDDGSMGGLLAGVGVLGGLLFQVLAWVATRLATVADTIGPRKPTPDEIWLLERLDIARANLGYAALVSIVLVTLLGVGAMLTSQPTWLLVVDMFLLVHLSTTLILVLLRVSAIGEDDRVTALTSHAVSRSRPPKQDSAA